MDENNLDYFLCHIKYNHVQHLKISKREYLNSNILFCRVYMAPKRTTVSFSSEDAPKLKDSNKTYM